MAEARAKPKQWTFHTSTTWRKGGPHTLSCEGRPSLAVSSPEEFGGAAGAWTPEDLVVGAVESCMMLTFLYYVGKQGIRLIEYGSEAEGVLESGPDGMQFTAFTVRPRIVVPQADVAKTEKAIKAAAESCLVDRSLNGTTTVEPEVVAG